MIVLDDSRRTFVVVNFLGKDFYWLIIRVTNHML